MHSFIHREAATAILQGETSVLSDKTTFVSKLAEGW
jgi:hypothetical protein